MPIQSVNWLLLYTHNTTTGDSTPSLQDSIAKAAAAVIWHPAIHPYSQRRRTCLCMVRTSCCSLIVTTTFRNIIYMRENTNISFKWSIHFISTATRQQTWLYPGICLLHTFTRAMSSRTIMTLVVVEYLFSLFPLVFSSRTFHCDFSVS